MGKATRIMRVSIFTFLRSFHLFTSTPALLAVPFAAAVLLLQPLVSSSSLLVAVHARLRSLFVVAGFWGSLELFSVLCLKLSQTAVCYLFSLPFTLSFLLPAKSFTLMLLRRSTCYSSVWDFTILPVTQLCASFVLLAANATCFCILFICFSFVDFLGVLNPVFKLIISAGGIIFYAVLVANASVICNLSLIISWIDKRGGFISILKACFLIRGHTAAAMSLAASVNMGLASMEALFQYRVLMTSQRSKYALVFEAILIACMYALILALDTIVGFMLLKSCEKDYEIHQEEYQKDHVWIQGKNWETRDSGACAEKPFLFPV